MTREEAIKIIDCYDIGFYDLSGEKIPADKLAEAIDIAIEALSADTKAVYCWECKYQHDCVQYMLVEGKYEIIHSCSYGGRKEE